jgi:hypothetical protein
MLHSMATEGARQLLPPGASNDRSVRAGGRALPNMNVNSEGVQRAWSLSRLT